MLMWPAAGNQLDQSISVLKVTRWYFLHFIFYSNFNGTLCKQTAEALIRSCILLKNAGFV